MSPFTPAVLIATVLAAPLSAQCPETERRILEELDRTFSHAQDNGDQGVLDRILADEYLAIGLIGVSEPKQQTISNWVRTADGYRSGMRAAPRRVFDHYVITCTPNTATITHRSTSTSQVGGQDRTTLSRSVHVLEKRDGQWRFVSNTGHPLDDTAILIYMQSDWAEAIRKRDTAWFTRHFADDATFVQPNGEMQSKAEVIAAAQKDRRRIDAAEVSNITVRMVGDAAVMTGTARLRGADEQGKPFDDRFRWTDTMVKRDGRWLVLASQATLVP